MNLGGKRGCSVGTPVILTTTMKDMSQPDLKIGNSKKCQHSPEMDKCFMK